MPERKTEFGTRQTGPHGTPADKAAPKKDPSDALGFAHHAHQPDPSASYSFSDAKPATLPHDTKRRWKVTG